VFSGWVRGRWECRRLEVEVYPRENRRYRHGETPAASYGQ